MTKKLSVALGLREKTEKDNQNMLTDMQEKFKKNQGLFIGFRNTFVPLEGHPDMPENRKSQKVASTVKEQLDWLKVHSKDYLDTVLSIEKTNAQNVTGELVVRGESWGRYTTLELLRLKGVLDSKLRAVIQILPVRSESILWSKSTDPMYEGRDIYEDRLDEGFNKTTIKRIEIVNDPHIKDSPGRAPITQPIDTPVNVGKYTKQNFTGAITLEERAKMEVAYNDLYKGVIAALEEANNTQLVESDLGDKVLNYLFK